MPKINVSPIARSVPFDNTDSDMVSTDVQSAIKEIKDDLTASASPGFSFGRSGTVTTGSYLLNETVSSNVSGRWVYINNASIKKVFVSNEIAADVKIEVLYHNGNGSGLTSLGTVTLPSAKGSSFSVNWPVPTNVQIAVRVATNSTSSGKNMVVGLQLAGTT